MADSPRPEILGPQLPDRYRWRARLLDPAADWSRLTVVVTPYRGVLADVRERYPARDIVVVSTDPSAVEAALLLQAGADAYLSDPATLGPAIRGLRDGRVWLSPVGAVGLCRLARLPGDPAFDLLAAAARLAATGRPWPAVCRTLGLRGTRQTLRALRRAL